MLALSFNAQVYDLNDTTIEKSDAPNGAYFKDIYGTLNPYIGVWTTTWNSKTAYLEFKKIKYKMQDLNGDFICVDSILGERKIINANGVVEIDRISNFDVIDPEFTLAYISHIPVEYQTILFFPKNMCSKMAKLEVKFLNPQKTQMKMKFRYEPSFLEDDCQYHDLIVNGGDFPINFPKEDVIFTKQ